MLGGRTKFCLGIFQVANFRNLRNGAETVHRHPVFACNSPFHAHAINFYNFLSHLINGH